MTSIKTGAPSGLNGRGGPPLARAGVPLPIRQKRPGYAALAVVLIVGLALAGGYFYSQAGKKVPVVEVVNDIPVGHTIQRSDLSTVDVAGGVTAIGGANLSSVVGQTAVVELLPHTLLQRSMVTSSPSVDTSQAQVGVQVKPGQIPANGLSPGNHVEVVRLPPSNATSGAPGGTSATVLVGDATVYSSVTDPSQSGGTLLTLVVPKSSATDVASASNAGAIALIRIGQ